MYGDLDSLKMNIVGWTNKNHSISVAYPYLAQIKAEINKIIQLETGNIEAIPSQGTKDKSETNSKQEQLSLTKYIEESEEGEHTSLDEFKSNDFRPELKHTRIAFDNLYQSMKKKERLILSDKQITLKLGLIGREDLLPKINQERDKISKIFMHNEVLKEQLKQNKNIEDQKDFEELTYSLNNIRTLINKNLSNDQLLDILFYWPFKFPDYKEEVFEINSNENESLKIFFPISTPDSKQRTIK